MSALKILSGAQSPANTPGNRASTEPAGTRSTPERHAGTRTPFERFIDALPAKVAARSGEPIEPRFERLKREYRKANPQSGHAQYAQAMQAIRSALEAK